MLMQKSSIVTRCPQCQTAFRVTYAQMNVAKGAVRCGSCLSIFRALDHEQSDDSPQETPAKAAKTPRAASQPALSKKSTLAPVAQTPPEPKAKTENTFSLDIDEEMLEDNELIDNELDQESDDFYFYDKEIPAADKNTSIFGATSTKPVTESTQEKADESWALDILAELEDDDDDDTLSLKLPNRTPKLSLDELETDTTQEPHSADNVTPIRKVVEPAVTLDKENIEPVFDNTPANDEFDNTIDYQELIDEEAQPEIAASRQQSAQSTAQASNDDIDDLEFYYDESFESDESSDSIPIEVAQAEPPVDGFEENLESLISDEEIDDAMDAVPSYKQELQGMIKGIQSAPVEMGAYESEEKRKWLWRVALVAVCLLLAAQLIYFRFDSLSKHPTYRPLLTHICSIIGCQIPPWVAVDKIRSNNLIVRSHPTAANALLVDVILINNANFEQPYPALSLEFSTLGDSLVAASEMQPAQYLRGELAGSRLMPIGQPIQISLSIQDPGSDAVNYRLNILQANL